MAQADSLHTDYDVVIVGAGMGGLTCATYLARRGLRVLVCEKEAKAGGLFGSFKRRGFVFDRALPSIRSAGLVFHLLDDLGIRRELTFLESPYRIISRHCNFTANSIEDVIRGLSEAFPEDKTGINAYFSLLRRISQGILSISSAENPILVKEGKARLQSLLPFLFDSRDFFVDYFRYRRLLAEEKIRNLIHNEDLRNLLITVGFCFHKNMLIDALVWSSLVLDSYYPQGGIGRIPDILVDLIRRYGGKVAFNTKVERIRVQRGKASGVILTNGRQIESRFVVSNADYKQTFLSLVEAGQLPSRFCERVERGAVSESLFTAYLGLNCPARKLLKGKAPNIMYFPTYMYINFNKAARDEAYFRKAWQCISVPSLLDPSLAPKGKSVVILRTWTTSDYQDGWHGGKLHGEQSGAYQRLMERIGEDMIITAEAVLPGLRSHIEYSEFASPLTYERVTGNTDGAVNGWSIDPERQFYRDLFRQVQGYLSPVPNLFMVGQWVAHPGGLPVSLASGRWVADLVTSGTPGGSFLQNMPTPVRYCAETLIERSLAFMSSWK